MGKPQPISGISPAIAVLFFGLAGCGHDAPATGEQRTLATSFLNLSPGVAYVGDDACFDCHEDQYIGFKEHGMAGSLYPLNSETAVEMFDSEVVLDARTGLYYRTFESDGLYFMEEYRLDSAGEKSHTLVRQMKYVIGSGTSAHTYLTEDNGWYYEMPITWYTQVEKWDFSPGYQVVNQRFDRKIADRCIVCHNSYPEPVPHSNGQYTSMPYGIGCERCHGPGELHIDERLSVPEPSDSVDYTIVNPAHLSLDLRLDVCQQCHLNATVSVLRDGRTAYDFRPSQPLSEYISLFSRLESNSDDEIGVISHADRMKKSVCFLATRSRNRPLECTTCHDPHSGFRGEGDDYFNNTCMSCHATKKLQASMVTDSLALDHGGAGNCISCHMPKKDLIEAPHSAFTDHWIRIVDEDTARPQPVHATVSLVPYFEEDTYEEGMVYEGMSYVIYGRQTNDMESVRKGIDILDEAFHAGFETSEAVYLHGLGYQMLALQEQAIPSLEKAVTLDPGIPERLNALAQAYEATGRSEVSIERLYLRALSIQPDNADIRINYGRFQESRGRLDDAISEYDQSIRSEPWNALAFYNLGTAYLRDGRTQEAETMLLRSIALNPLYSRAWSNLGFLYVAADKLDDARAAFEAGVEADPERPEALANLGTYYLNTDDLARAIKLLGRADEIRPGDADVLSKLALAHFRNDDFGRAREAAERALRADPDHPAARQILAAI